jgi:hypothetical protein
MEKINKAFKSDTFVKDFESAVNQVEQLQAALNDESGA